MSSQVSELSVSIRCCIVQEPLNDVKGDESMPRKYNCGMTFLCVYVWQNPSFEHGWEGLFKGEWNPWDSPK